ncbi:hypothetical protein ASZ90_011944 [hydrocarbon metagenome]|uniref:Uncharacterized protein n=1 Tax=hydrocarbon metagenome TaxID=938273 RepID=A0A0W8FC52_9ZZZZ
MPFIPAAASCGVLRLKINLKPIEYRADWPHMGHQRLFFW